MEFFSMTELPKVAKDLRGMETPFSVPVIVYDEEDLDFFNIGYYNFNTGEWNHFGEESMKLICWCYVPSPTEFLKNKNFISVKHNGYVE